MAWDLALVAGGGGFVGGHLVAALRAAGTRVRAVDRAPLSQWRQRFDDVENVCLDLADLDACREVCRDVVEVYHFAAESPAGGAAPGEADRMLSVRTGTHLLLASRERGVRRFFLASSACVYARDRQPAAGSALREEDAHPAAPEGGAGWEKLFLERLCRHVAAEHGLPTRVARFGEIYGPHGAFAGGGESAAAALCRRVQEAIETGSGELEIEGDGTDAHAFLHVDDCVTATLGLMRSRVGAPRNLGGEETVSLAGLASIVEETAGVRLARRHLAARAPAARALDCARLRDELGWRPTVSLREGIRQTYAWIAAARGHARRVAERAVVLPAAAAKGRRALAHR